MSYHLLHILNGGGLLKKHRGNLIYESNKNDFSRQIALEDLRGIILAAPDIVLTDSLIGALLEKDVFILHCDKKYKPIGLTEPLQRLVNTSTMKAQIAATTTLTRSIWNQLVLAKVQNQINVLKTLKLSHHYLSKKISEKTVNESACARHYWKEFFKSLGYNNLTRRNDVEHKVNGMLNYGYAVLGGLCHRSLVAHGLSPLLGVHHQGSFHSTPLVYDVIEPWRPFVDFQLFLHLRNSPQSDMKSWVKASCECWEQDVVVSDKNQQKLVDAIDHCITSLSLVFNGKKIEKLWLPKMIFTD